MPPHRHSHRRRSRDSEELFLEQRRFMRRATFFVFLRVWTPLVFVAILLAAAIFAGTLFSQKSAEKLRSDFAAENTLHPPLSAVQPPVIYAPLPDYTTFRNPQNSKK